jgi:hypothetical protein
MSTQSTQFEIEVEVADVPELDRSNTQNELAEAKTADDVAELINGDVTDPYPVVETLPAESVAEPVDKPVDGPVDTEIESDSKWEVVTVGQGIEKGIQSLASFEDGYEQLSDDEKIAFDRAFAKYTRASWKAEDDHKDQIQNLKEAHTSASLIRSRIEGELKAAKKTEKSILGELETLIAKGPEYPEKPTPDMFVGKGADSVLEPTSPLSQSSGANEFDFSQDETWRAISTELVLEKIASGLGPKKRDAILSEFPTLGALVECKIEASKEFVHFSQKLPKGVGVELADSIEDAIEATLAIHRKRLIAQCWESTVPAAEVEQDDADEVESDEVESDEVESDEVESDEVGSDEVGSDDTEVIEEAEEAGAIEATEEAESIIEPVTESIDALDDF